MRRSAYKTTVDRAANLLIVTAAAVLAIWIGWGFVLALGLLTVVRIGQALRARLSEPTKWVDVTDRVASVEVRSGRGR